MPLGRVKLVACAGQQYDFNQLGLPGHERATGKKNAKLAEALTRMAPHAKQADPPA